MDPGESHPAQQDPSHTTRPVPLSQVSTLYLYEALTSWEIRLARARDKERKKKQEQHDIHHEGNIPLAFNAADRPRHRQAGQIRLPLLNQIIIITHRLMCHCLRSFCFFSSFFFPHPGQHLLRGVRHNPSSRSSYTRALAQLLARD